MADEVRTTRYLYEFSAAGVEKVDQQFQQAINKLSTYEAQIAQKMQNIDRLLSSKGGAGAAPTVAMPVIDTSSIRQAEQAIAQAQQITSQMTQAATAVTMTAQGKLLSSYSETRDGVQRVKETTTALEDQYKTVITSRQEWDKLGTDMGTMTRTVRTLPGGIKETTVAIEGLNQQMRGGATYSDQFIRHLRWISQGIVLWAGINAVTGAISDWVMVQKELNQALAEYEMRTGAGATQTEAFRQNILSASQQTGVSPVAISQVAAVAPDEATIRYAAQLQRVAGGDMQNQMQWLIAQQRQFGQEGENTVQVLNAMASGWRLTTLPMSQFITMLRDAAPLSQEFNLSMQEMYSMFGALQAVTGAEGKELDYLVRNLSKLYEPTTQRQLGIQTTRVLPSGDVERRNIIAVLDEVNQKIKEGEITVEQFAAMFGATGRGQRQQIQRVMMAWDSFIQAMGSSMDTPAQWSDMFATAMDTPIAKTDALKSAWERMLASIGDTTAFENAIEGITGLLDGLTAIISSKADEFSKTWESSIEPADLMKLLTPQGSISTILDLFKRRGEPGDIERGLEASNSRWAAMGESYGGRQALTRSYQPGGGAPFTGVPELPSWPSMTTIPQGVDFSEVIQSMEEWVAAFSALGPEFANWIDANMQATMIYDENSRHLQMMNVFLPALQRAIAENTQAQKQQDLQPNLRNTNLDLSQQGGLLTQWVQYYTQFLNRMGFPQESQPQLVLGQNDTFLRLWASNEALMLALRALTEATEDQTDILSGMWNVPEGATMFVPIQSLFYSRKPGGAETPGTFPLPPTTMPPQQEEWMGLPGAVDQMSVGTMTVTNLEGITTDVAGATGKEDMQALATKLYEQQNSMLSAVNLLGDVFGGAAGMPQINFDQIGEYISRSITALQERFGTPGPEPTGPSVDLSRLLSGATISPSEMTAGSLEIQTPQADLMSPTTKSTSMSTDIMSPRTWVTTSVIELLTTSITGFPTFDTATMETILQTIAGTLVSILGSLQSSAPATTAAQDPYTPSNSSTAFPVGSPTPEDVARLQDEKNWWDWTNYSRMRSSF